MGALLLQEGPKTYGLPGPFISANIDINGPRPKYFGPGGPFVEEPIYYNTPGEPVI